MPRILNSPDRDAASPAGSRHDLENQAVLDVLHGDYLPAAPNHPPQTDPRAAPRVIGSLTRR